MSGTERDLPTDAREGIAAVGRAMMQSKQGPGPLSMVGALVSLATPANVAVMLTFYFEAVALLAEGLGVDESVVHERVESKAVDWYLGALDTFGDLLRGVQ